MPRAKNQNKTPVGDEKVEERPEIDPRLIRDLDLLYGELLRSRAALRAIMDSIRLHLDNAKYAVVSKEIEELEKMWGKTTDLMLTVDRALFQMMIEVERIRYRFSSLDRQEL